MTAQELVNALAAKVGLASLSFDAQGVAELPVDDETDVLFVTDDSLPGRMDVMAAVGPLPEGGLREPVLRRLLAANLFGQQTSGFVLSVDPATEAIVLHRRLDLARTDSDSLAKSVEGLLNEVARWRAETSR